MLAGAPTEGRLFGYLMVGMTIILIGKLAGLTVLHPPDSTALVGRALAEIVSWLFFVPLAYFALAALGTVLARAFGGVGSWRDGRAAFFWAVLVSAPVIAATAVLPTALAALPTWLAAEADGLGFVFLYWTLAQCFAEAFGFPQAWWVFAAMCVPVAIVFLALRLAG